VRQTLQFRLRLDNAADAQPYGDIDVELGGANIQHSDYRSSIEGEMRLHLQFNSNPMQSATHGMRGGAAEIRIFCQPHAALRRPLCSGLHCGCVARPPL
jgi:hypothetical protein